MLNVYSTKEKFPISTYIDSKLVNLVKNKPSSYATIEKKACACNSKNGIAVNKGSIFIDNLDNYVKNHETYVFDFQSEEEIESAVFFLLKSHFQTFGSSCFRSGFKRHYSDDFFFVHTKLCGCVEYKLKGKPVYCLESVVVSAEKSDLTVRAVIDI